MGNFSIVLILAAIMLTLGLIEGRRHRAGLKRIPIRIHVNGTRGKSSVTRLIAGGLRAGGIVTCAKTTGTEPRMILPDASEYAIYRPARANIIEQVRIVSTAVETGAQALVVECMALNPRLQSLSELRLVRSTHGVITNVRPDHLDVMGPGEYDVALSLAGAIPVDGTLFTTEERHLEPLRAAAADRGTGVVEVSRDEVERVGERELHGFGYVEHRDNVALALRVCEALGVERETALRGMWAASPDPGVLTVHELQFFGRQVFFANALAANDPDSTALIWKSVLEMFPDVERRIALFNCRGDRPERSRQLGQSCMGWPAADQYVLMGSGTYIFAREATRHGLDVRRLTLVEQQEVGEIFETLLELAGSSCLIVGMGNVHGGGAEVARLFRNRGIKLDLHAWT